MKDQVTTIEQSKRLIELGVPADRASMVWEWVSSAVDEINYELNIWQGCKLDKILAYQEFPESFIPAFTVADLLILLSDMAEKCGVSIRLHQEVGSICYAVYVDDCLIFPYEERSFVDMLVQGIIYLEPKYSKCYK